MVWFGTALSVEYLRATVENTQHQARTLAHTHTRTLPILLADAPNTALGEVPDKVGCVHKSVLCLFPGPQHF